MTGLLLKKNLDHLNRIETLDVMIHLYQDHARQIYEGTRNNRTLTWKDLWQNSKIREEFQNFVTNNLKEVRKGQQEWRINRFFNEQHQEVLLEIWERALQASSGMPDDTPPKR